MKTFKDISWKQHEVFIGAIQGMLVLDNGIEFSIIAGPRTSSTPKAHGQLPSDFVSFEVAVFNEDCVMIEPILTYLDRTEIDILINHHS